MSQPISLVSDGDGPTADLEDVAGSRAELRALCEAMTELPRHQREAILLREFYGLSYDEVGVALGVSTSAVDSLLVRARKRLEQELRPARTASAALIVPVALRESLINALPGFASGGAAAGAVATGAGIPLAAKLCAGALALVATGSVAVTAVPHGASRGITLGVQDARATEPAPRQAAASSHSEVVAALAADSQPHPHRAGQRVDDDLGGDRGRDGDSRTGGSALDERDEEENHASDEGIRGDEGSDDDDARSEGPNEDDDEGQGGGSDDGPSNGDGEGGGDEEERGSDEPEPSQDESSSEEG